MKFEVQVMFLHKYVPHILCIHGTHRKMICCWGEEIIRCLSLQYTRPVSLTER